MEETTAPAAAAPEGAPEAAPEAAPPQVETFSHSAGGVQTQVTLIPPGAARPPGMGNVTPLRPDQRPPPAAPPPPPAAPAALIPEVLPEPGTAQAWAYLLGRLEGELPRIRELLNNAKARGQAVTRAQDLASVWLELYPGRAAAEDPATAARLAHLKRILDRAVLGAL